MIANVSVTDVIDALKAEGFNFVGKSGRGWFVLRGGIIPEGSAVNYSCEVELDPEFIEFPRVRLLELPQNMPEVLPHLGANGGLCYIAHGSVVLDMYDPIGQSIACLRRASAVLGQIIAGTMIEDLAEEFFAYWHGANYCFLDLQNSNLGTQKCTVLRNADRRWWFVTDDKERTRKKTDALGWNINGQDALVYLIGSKVPPKPLINKWPPKNVGDILEWQSTLDSNCRRKIHERIKQAKKLKAREVLIVIDSPKLKYGFEVIISNLPVRTVDAIGRDMTYTYPAHPINVMRIDDQYISERNAPGLKTLAGKHIVLIGCGTIGGYLSDMLVKSGAGTSGGLLTLVDNDYFSAQNIGRHRLGFPGILEKKSDALAAELMRQSPGAEIRSLPVDVKKAHIAVADLVIDATGEETLGHWLCAKFSGSTDMLSVWIEGPGTAVRSLLKSGKNGACFRCLWQNNREGHLRSIEGPVPEVFAGHGCEGLYVPFPAYVSVQAASLGAKAVTDWINNISSPTLRTRLIDETKKIATPDCSPPSHAECPICSS
ncbi:ThiF family adenylyltransferase [Lysobacter enzymogenes]|uniref:Thiamine biosynthesis protein ThiF n=1 Tax=Lysobacter enzymogenes TaxID=69 RepID=A0A3N2RDQ2_LYSEN|nr:ThiF family adenylyltransferase [Lysobacter enzymogenes]ROU05506.1 thiamine biosynthesis protein ThiF [Lysobacter enzymogenes]